MSSVWSDATRPAQANINNTAQQGMLVERLHLWLENKQKMGIVPVAKSLILSVSGIKMQLLLE